MEYNYRDLPGGGIHTLHFSGEFLAVADRNQRMRLDLLIKMEMPLPDDLPGPKTLKRNHPKTLKENVPTRVENVKKTWKT